MRNFKEKYKHVIYRMEEANVEEITVDLIHETMISSGKTAGGMDGWQPAELALVSEGISAWIAELFKLIEQGERVAKGLPPCESDVSRKRRQ